MTEPREPENYPVTNEGTPAQPSPAAEPPAARFASEEPSRAEAWTELPRLAAPAEPATGPEPAAERPNWAAPSAQPAPTLPAAPAWTAPAAPPAPVLPPPPVWGAPLSDSATSGWVAPPVVEPVAPEPEPVAPEPEPVAPSSFAAQPVAEPLVPEPVSFAPAEPVVPVPAPQPVYAEPEPVAQWGSAPTPAEEPSPSPYSAFAEPAPDLAPAEVAAPVTADPIIPSAPQPVAAEQPVAAWVSVPSPVVTPEPADAPVPSPVAEPADAPVPSPVAEPAEAAAEPDELEEVDEPAEPPAAVWAATSPTALSGPVPFSQVAAGSMPVSVATPSVGPAPVASSAPSPVATEPAHDDIFRTEESLASAQEPSEEEVKLAAERAARREAREAALVAPTAVAPAVVVKAEPVRVEKRTNDKFVGSLGLFLLRLIVAGVFAIRGLGILTNLPAATKTFAATVLPQPELWAIITGASSLAIALALVLGLLTRVAGLGIALIAGGALALVYWGSSFSPFVAGQPGFYGELELLLVGVGVLFLTVGAGGWSLDRSFRDARGQDRADEED